MTILGMIFNAIHIFITLFASWHRTCKRFFIWWTISNGTRMPVYRNNTQKKLFTTVDFCTYIRHTKAFNKIILPASVSHYKFWTKLFRCPRIITILGLGYHHFIFIHFTAQIFICLYVRYIKYIIGISAKSKWMIIIVCSCVDVDGWLVCN